MHIIEYQLCDGLPKARSRNSLMLSSLHVPNLAEHCYQGNTFSKHDSIFFGLFTINFAVGREPAAKSSWRACHDDDGFTVGSQGGRHHPGHYKSSVIQRSSNSSCSSYGSVYICNGSSRTRWKGVSYESFG